LENIVRIAFGASAWIIGVNFRFTISGFSGLFYILLFEGVEGRISIKLIFIQIQESLLWVATLGWLVGLVHFARNRSYILHGGILISSLVIELFWCPG
jgi:hypothetical protein